MATDPPYQPITADQFLAMDFSSDRKFELSNGVIQMMTGDVFVDPVNRLTCVLQRRGDGWMDETFAQPHDVHLPSLSITLPEAEIFARD